MRNKNVHPVLKLNLEYFGEHQQIPEPAALELCHPSLAYVRNRSLIHQSSCSRDNQRLHQQVPLTKVALWPLLLHGLGIQQEEPEPEIINCQSSLERWQKLFQKK